MVKVSELRRWVWVTMLVELFAPAAVVLAASADPPKPQRLRKKKHFMQAHNGDAISEEIAQANQHATHLSEKAATQQAGQFHEPEPSAVYVKCRSLLEGVGGDDSLVSKPEFVQFLRTLTGGNVDAETFDDLEGRWAGIFYRTACGQGGQCDGDSVAIALENTRENYEEIVAFCDRIMAQATTTATLTFGYSIQYDTDIIDEDALPDCLEQATTNLLLDNFGCATNSNVQLQLERRETGIRGSHPGRKTSAIRFESEEERMFAELLLREEEDRRFLDTNMSMEDCEYDIDVEVPNIIPLGCIPPAPEESTLECGLVRSTVTVTTSQENFPFEAELRLNITDALRVAIDGDAFESYFPEDCLLQTRRL